MNNSLSSSPSIKDWFSQATAFFKLHSASLVPLVAGFYLLVSVLISLLPSNSSSIAYVFVNLVIVSYLYYLYKNHPTPITFMEILKVKDIKLDVIFKGFLPYYFLTILLTLLFIIPGIIFGVYWSLWQFVILDRGIIGRPALNESKRLVKGHWWQIFAVSTLNIICIILVNFIPLTGLVATAVIDIMTGLVATYFSLVLMFAYFSLSSRSSPAEAPPT